MVTFACHFLLVNFNKLKLLHLLVQVKKVYINVIILISVSTSGLSYKDQYHEWHENLCQKCDVTF